MWPTESAAGHLLELEAFEEHNLVSSLDPDVGADGHLDRSLKDALDSQLEDLDGRARLERTLKIDAELALAGDLRNDLDLLRLSFPIA